MVILVLANVKLPPLNVIPGYDALILLIKLLAEKLAVPPVILIPILEVEKVELLRLAIAPVYRDNGDPENLVTVDPVRFKV